MELPEAALMIWRWFIDLNNSRQSGMGINPISYTEMHSYFMLNQIVPAEYEVQMIKALDNIAMKHYSDQQEKENNKAKTKKK